MPKSDAWEWPMLYYIATVTLKMSPAIFWRLTPRKLSALAKVHSEMNGGSDSGSNKGGSPSKPKVGFIDQVM